MKHADAPPAGWYPDPEGGSRLRWWEGDDWSNRYRSRPAPLSAHIPHSSAPQSQSMQEGGWPGQGTPLPSQLSNMESAQIVEQVRRAAREEAQRASQLFGQQARAVTRNVAPLITEYTTKITRVIRTLSVIAVVLLVLWLAFQVFAQQSMWDWVGDRIDNLTDDSSASLTGFAQVVLRR